MITFPCSGCGNQLQIHNELAGREATCPHCGQILPIPSTQIEPATADAIGAITETSWLLSPTAPGTEKTVVKAALLLKHEADPEAGLSPSPDEIPGISEANRATVSDAAAPTLPFTPPAADVSPADPHAGPAIPQEFAFLAPSQDSGELGRLGPYHVVKVLGVGGMGVVFQAKDPHLERFVALKAILPNSASNSAARKRFLREAKAVASVKHDHIVIIHQVGEDRGIPFLAMEFLEGESLCDRLKRDGKLPVHTILRIGMEITEGLAAAHERGLIHRDIKPGNIWLEGARERVKILDFGLAQLAALTEPLTQAGSIVGTPAYMAPEQARGKVVDQRADLFSLGCVLYRMCTGNPPFQRADTIATLTAVALDTPSSPAEVDPSVPAVLSDLVMCLLNKDPADRPKSARAVAERIKTIEQELTPGADSREISRTAGGAPCQTQGRKNDPVAAALQDIPSSARAPLDNFVARSEERTKPLNIPGATPAPADARVAKRPLVLVAAAAVSLIGVAWAAGYLFVRIKSPDGKVTEIRVPEGSTVDVQEEKVIGPTVPETGNMVARVPSPFDDRDPAKIPAEERSADQPKELAAVLGDSRLKHWDYLYGLAFSPDGMLLASASKDCRVILWDAGTGRVRHAFPLSDVARQVAFTADGKLLAARCDDRKVYVWDVVTGQEKRTFDECNRLAVSPAGNRLAVRCADGSVQVWNTLTWQQERAFAPLAPGDEQHIESVTFSPDGRRLALWSADGSIRQYEMSSGKEQSPVLKTDFSGEYLAFHPGGKLLAGSNAAGDIVKVWDLATGKEVLSAKGQFGGAYSPAFSPDGAMLALGGFEEVMIWEVSTWKLRSYHWQGMGRGAYHATAFSPDGKTLAVGSFNPAIQLLDSANGEERPLTAGSTGDAKVAVSSDGRLVVMGDLSGTVRCWDLTRYPGQGPSTLNGAPTVSAVDFVPHGSMFILGRGTWGSDGQVEFWDPVTRQLTRQLKQPALVTALAVSPDGERLALGVKDKMLKVLDLETGRPLTTFRGQTGNVFTILFSPNGRRIFSSGEEPFVRVWDAQTGNEEMTIPATQADSIRGIALSPDGKHLASTGSHQDFYNGLVDGDVKLWDAATGKLVRTLLSGQDRGGDSIAFSPDGSRLAWACTDGMIRIWDVPSADLRQTIVVGPPSCLMFRAVFGPDGRHLFTTNGNGTVYVLRLDPPAAKEGK